MRHLAVLSWFIPALAGAAPLPDAVPIEVFAAPPAIENPLLSPDGSRIAAKFLLSGKQSLVVAPLAGGAKPTRFEFGKVDVNGWQWVNDQWLVVSLGAEEKYGNGSLYVTRLAGVNAIDGRVVQIDWKHSGLDADNIMWVASDGSPRIVFSKQASIDFNWSYSVFEADVSTGATRLVQKSKDGISRWFADGAGQVRLGIGNEWLNKYTNVIYRRTNAEPFEQLPIKIKKDGDFPVPLTYRRDGSAIAISNRNGYDEVYELQLPSFNFGKKLFAAPGYDVVAVIDNLAGDDIAGISYIGKTERTVWLDPQFRDIQASLDRTVGENIARLVSWDRKATRLLVEMGKPSQAGGLYYWDTRSAAMQRFAWNNATLKGRSLSEVKTIQYKARDGTPIEAVLTMPRGRAPTKLPLIIMPHGGPAARDHEKFDWWVQYLTEQGYVVLQPNYRGSTGYGTAFTKLGEGEWGMKMQDDLLDGIDWLATQGIADPARTCIVGASYGGYTAMRGAQRDGTRYRCAVSFAGVSDLQAMRDYHSSFLGRYVASREFWAKQAPHLAAVSPRMHAKEFSAPILLLHGKEDIRVPVNQSRNMANQLRKAGKPYEYVELPEADHHLSRTDDRITLLKAIKAFLDRYNPA